MFLENALLIGSNFIPLFGVLFWDWTIESILFIYWSETLIIGLFSILKICFAKFHTEGKPNWIVTKINSVLFFLMHFTPFCLAQGLVLISILKNFNGAENIEPKQYITPIIALIISHGYSFLKNYLYNKEYQTATTQKLMTAPYRRILLMQILIIIGSFLYFSVFKSSMIFLILLLIGKILIDLESHQKSHFKTENEGPLPIIELTQKEKVSSILQTPRILIMFVFFVWVFSEIFKQFFNSVF